MLWPSLGSAQSVQLPVGARQLSERATALGSYALPLGPAVERRVPSREVEGRILRRSWRLSGDATVLQILAPLRAQLEADGFEILFQCAARSCGGFDFRFDIETIPAPDMTIDIGKFNFLSAENADGRIVTLLVSRSGRATYVQAIEVTPTTASASGAAIGGAAISAQGASSATGDAAGQLQPEQTGQGVLGQTDPITLLQDFGHAVLADLEFDPGAVTLGARPYASLAALTAYLQANPTATILLVGHTDTVGSLAQNVAISEQRAQAVRARMLVDSDLEPARIAVAGAGFMAPRTSNQTAAGREVNRRVEVVLITP
ncbi:OmpA family protein [Phaeobacter sp.]|uniref:OmpA family protein n=1 Tax=Phaeobacter sp. TaxID=1902409 RepID=UPI0026006009|nr:OmpA family protein [Phaeobacter sp.]